MISLSLAEFTKRMFKVKSVFLLFLFFFSIYLLLPSTVFTVYINLNVLSKHAEQRTKSVLTQTADNAGPDQPAHSRRLIRAFVARLQNQ